MTRTQKLDDLARAIARHVEEFCPKPLNINREAFEQFAHYVPSILWTASCHGRVCYVNPAFSDFTGLAPDDYLAAFHPDDADRLKDAFRHHAATQRSVYTESARVMGADGQYHWVLTRACPVILPDGSLSFWIGSSAVMVSHAVLANQAA